MSSQLEVPPSHPSSGASERVQRKALAGADSVAHRFLSATFVGLSNNQQVGYGWRCLIVREELRAYATRHAAEAGAAPTMAHLLDVATALERVWSWGPHRWGEPVRATAVTNDTFEAVRSAALAVQAARRAGVRPDRIFASGGFARA